MHAFSFFADSACQGVPMDVCNPCCVDDTSSQALSHLHRIQVRGWSAAIGLT